VQTGTTGTLPRAAYSLFALPSASCTFTTTGRSEWMLLNAPVNVSGDKVTHAYRLRLKGRMRASDLEPVVLGEREVELFAQPCALQARRCLRGHLGCSAALSLESVANF
jgi:hypothetical protein